MHNLTENRLKETDFQIKMIKNINCQKSTTEVKENSCTVFILREFAFSFGLGFGVCDLFYFHIRENHHEFCLIPFLQYGRRESGKSCLRMNEAKPWRKCFFHIICFLRHFTTSHKLVLVFILSCTVVSVLASNVPSTMSKTPSAKSLRIKQNTVSRPPRNKERYDSSVNDYLSERICGFNEMCKEEFSTKFRCRCPYWSFCSSPGRYYNAFCVMSGAGYLWTQPQGFFNNQPSKSTRYKKKLHNVHKTKSEKSLPHSLTSK